MINYKGIPTCSPFSLAEIIKSKTGDADVEVIFGFDSMESAYRWFNKDETLKMLEIGIKITCWELPEEYCSFFESGQVMFPKKYAKLAA